MDLFPTLCELTGEPIPADVQGTSLVPVLRNPATIVNAEAFSYNGAHVGLLTDRWSYMRYKDATEVLSKR